MAPGIDTTTIEARGLTFDARVAGPPDGDVALLLHGFPQGARSWDPLLTALAADGRRVVAFDQRGYSPGARPAGDEAYVMDELVADTLAVVDALGAERVDLIGHDWGGAVGWQVAARHPERLRTFTVLTTPHPRAFGAAVRGELGGDQPARSGYKELFSAPGTAELMAADDAAGLRAVFASTGLPDAEAQPYVEALGSVEALEAILAWYRSAGSDLIGELGPVEVPTLYVWGTDDPALGREAAEATADHVSGPYRFEALEGVGHWVVEGAGPALAPLVLDHLAG